MWIGAPPVHRIEPRQRLRQALRPYRAQAVRGEADPEARLRAVAAAHRLDDPEQPFGVVGEAALGAAGGRAAEPARVVQHRQEGERDARPPRRRRHTFRHLGEVVVGAAVRRVVQIVELGDRGVARLQHLAIELGRDGLDIVGAEPVDEAVHHLAPGPEAVPAGPSALGQPGHRPLEGVAVQVRHPGERDAADALAPIARLDPGDPPVVADFDPPRREPAVRGQHAVEHVDRHRQVRVQSTMAASISRSTGSTRSARSGR